MFVTSKVHNYDQIIYPTSGLIVPLSLFSGTYFPLASLPKGLQYLAYISPLTHAVEVTRSLQRGEFSLGGVLNISILILLLVMLFRLTVRAYEKRLID
jgi:lipooligosaccharide transport system permease protein